MRVRAPFLRIAIASTTGPNCEKYATWLGLGLGLGIGLGLGLG